MRPSLSLAVLLSVSACKPVNQVEAVPAQTIEVAAPSNTPLEEPPDNALYGVEREGVQVGIWSQKAIYSGTEPRNVWLFIRRKRNSMISVAEIYKDSRVSISDANGLSATIPVGAPVDGMVNWTYQAGGISESLAKLSVGDYELVWKTGDFISNRIKLKIQ